MMPNPRVTAVTAGIGAVVLTGAAVTDWVVGGVPSEGVPAAAMHSAHIGGYLLLLPAALAFRKRYAGLFGRVGRVAAVTLIGSLVAMTLGFVGLAAVGETEVVGILAGAGFLGMFLSALVLGVATWRRGSERVAAALLMAPFPLLAVLVATEALGIVSTHPAAMEGAVYFALAAFAAERLASESTTGATVQPAVD